MTLFTCSKCSKTHDESMFYKDKSKPSGYRPSCKDCDRGSVNKEKRSEYEKKYWSDRKVRRAEIVKKSMIKNMEHHKKKRKEYLKTEAGINTQRKSGQVTRSKKAGLYVEHVDPLSLYHEQNGVCYMCLEQFDFRDMEMDHLIPLSKGGKHEISNIKMCCSTCNKKKGVKLPEEMIYPLV